MFNFHFFAQATLPHALRGAIVTGFVLACLASPASFAAGHVRISTGKDLYEACKVLSDFSLNPEGRTPQPGLYCRKYIGGYFTSLKYGRGEGATRSSLGAPAVELAEAAFGTASPCPDK